MAMHAGSPKEPERANRWALVTSFEFLLSITFSVAVSVAAAITIQNQFFDDEDGAGGDGGGWTVNGPQTSTSLKVSVDGELEAKAGLDVNGNINITGSELQMAGSSCSRSEPGEGRLCFDGEAGKFTISQDGEAYVNLQGETGARGERGPQGPPGPAGPSARLWVSDATVGCSPTITILGSGFPSTAVVELFIGDSDFQRVETSDGGAFVLEEVQLPILEEGRYTSTITAMVRDAAVTHPLWVECVVVR